MSEQSNNEEKQIQFDKVWNDYPKAMEGFMQIYAKSWQMVIVPNPEPMKAILEGWTKPWNFNMLDKSNPFLKMLPQTSNKSNDNSVNFANFWWNPWELFGEQFKPFSELFQKFTESWMNACNQKSA